MKKLNDLLADIYYQLPIGVTTWGMCDNNCGNSARGCRVCISCLEKELADIVGSKIASDIVEKAKNIQKMRIEIEEIVNKCKSKL